jgi:hypothetical protein
MRTKQILILITMIGLLTLLTTSAYAATNFHPSTPSLVGTWQVTIKGDSVPQAAETFQTYFADGNFVEFNSFGETSHGVWFGSGNTYMTSFWGFTFDADGAYTGKQRVRAAIKMDGADHLTAEWVYDTIDLEGKVTEMVDTGTFEGTRMEVELP